MTAGVRVGIARADPVPDAMNPDFHGAGTHCNQGFMAFQGGGRASRTR